MPSLTQIEKAAKVAHEVNRIYCAIVLEDYSHSSWDSSPTWVHMSAMRGIVRHWEAMADGRTLSPEETHAAWLEEKQAEGWKFGIIKNSVEKTHPCMVEFKLLPKAQRMKDFLFKTVAEATYEGQAEKV